MLQENVSQSEANKTRFYVVSKQANAREGYDRAVGVASIMGEQLPGVLAQACEGSTELVCVHDRPEGSALGTYRYVIELARKDGFAAAELKRLEGIDQLTSLGRYGCVEA